MMGITAAREDLVGQVLGVVPGVPMMMTMMSMEMAIMTGNT
jgi:hypothetical protein